MVICVLAKISIIQISNCMNQKTLSTYIGINLEPKISGRDAITVGSHLSELQLSEHVGYPNAFSKATPTISSYFRRHEAVQMADIECFRARYTCCIAAEDTG